MARLKGRPVMNADAVNALYEVSGGLMPLSEPVYLLLDKLKSNGITDTGLRHLLDNLTNYTREAGGKKTTMKAVYEYVATMQRIAARGTDIGKSAGSGTVLLIAMMEEK